MNKNESIALAITQLCFTKLDQQDFDDEYLGIHEDLVRDFRKVFLQTVDSLNEMDKEDGPNDENIKKIKQKNDENIIEIGKMINDINNK